jgi:hypothetical protein
VLWFGQQEARDLAMTDQMLCEQARQFVPRFDVPNDFRYSNGWLGNFKKRQGIMQAALHGEANEADDPGVKLACKAIPQIVEEGGYPEITFIIRTKRGSSGGRVHSVPLLQASGRDGRRTSSA